MTTDTHTWSHPYAIMHGWSFETEAHDPNGRILCFVSREAAQTWGAANVSQDFGVIDLERSYPNTGAAGRLSVEVES